MSEQQLHQLNIKCLPKSMVTPRLTLFDSGNEPWPPARIPNGHLLAVSVLIVVATSSVEAG